MASVVEDYLIQRSQVVTAAALVRSVADKISEIASVIGTDPFECHVEGLGPNHVRIKGGRALQADEWPTAKDFYDALNAWANAEIATEAAWKKVPNEFRPGLHSPGERDEK